MKWILLSFLLLPSVYASKARVIALGQPEAIGSFYILDTRSVFRNPALIHEFGKIIFAEWGRSNDSTSSNNIPHAEGGFIWQKKKWSYGAYYGNEMESLNGKRKDPLGITGEAGFQAMDDPLTLFIGGDHFEKWGASFTYARKSDGRSNNTYEVNHRSYQAKLGIQTADAEFYMKYIIFDQSKGSNDERDRWNRRGKGLVGIKYEFKENTFLFGSFESDGAKYTNASSAELDYEILEYILGVAHIRPASTGQINLDAQLIVKKEQFLNTAGTKNLYRNIYVPVTIGYEAKALDWLILRGSLVYELYGYNKGVSALNDATKNEFKIKRFNSVTVNAGMTLDFGNLKIDGVIGYTDPTQTNNRSKFGILNLETLTSQTSITLQF